MACLINFQADFQHTQAFGLIEVIIDRAETHVVPTMLAWTEDLRKNGVSAVIDIKRDWFSGPTNGKASPQGLVYAAEAVITPCQPMVLQSHTHTREGCVCTVQYVCMPPARPCLLLSSA